MQISTGSKEERMAFDEDLLFTHRGLSGPAVLQISSYWREGTPLAINLAPTVDSARSAGSRPKARSRKAHRQRAGHAGAKPPGRCAGRSARPTGNAPVNEATDKALAQLAEQLARWELTPTGTEGYKKAEVTLGGVDTTRAVAADHGMQGPAGAVLHWRGGGCHGLAGRLQLSVGLGQRICLCAGIATARQSLLALRTIER